MSLDSACQGALATHPRVYESADQQTLRRGGIYFRQAPRRLCDPRFAATRSLERVTESELGKRSSLERDAAVSRPRPLCDEPAPLVPRRLREGVVSNLTSPSSSPVRQTRPLPGSWRSHVCERVISTLRNGSSGVPSPSCTEACVSVVRLKASPSLRTGTSGTQGLNGPVRNREGAGTRLMADSSSVVKLPDASARVPAAGTGWSTGRPAASKESRDMRRASFLRRLPLPRLPLPDFLFGAYRS
jgi:hypothetical protein